MNTEHQSPLMDSGEAVNNVEFSENDNSPNDLLETPRTRVKRMLAKFDDEYEPGATIIEKDIPSKDVGDDRNTQMDKDLQSKFGSAYERVKRQLQNEKKINNTSEKENHMDESLRNDSDNSQRTPILSSPVEQDSAQALPLDRESRLKQLVEKKKKELKSQQEDLFNLEGDTDGNDGSSGADSNQEDLGYESKSYGMERGYRKASRKALLELHQNTARLTREVAREPEIKIGKKVTINDFFDKIGFKPKTQSGIDMSNESPSAQKTPNEMSTEKKVVANHEEEGKNNADPLTPNDSSENITDKGMEPGELKLPDLGQSSLFNNMFPKETPPKLSIKEKIQRLSKNIYTGTSDSDSDLEIETRPKTVTLDTIQSVKSSENIDTVADRLKRLAGIRSPSKRNAKLEEKGFNFKEFNRDLMKRAAMMSKAEREETEKELESQGLLASGSEKDEEEQLGFVERARKEAERIRQKEQELDGGKSSDEDEEISSDGVPSDKAPKTLISDVIIQATQSESTDTSLKKRKNNRVVLDDDEMDEQDYSSSDMRVVDSDNEDDLRIHDFSQSSKECKEEKETKEDSSAFYLQGMLPSDSQLSIIDANFSQPPPRWALSNSTQLEDETQPTQIDAVVPTQVDSSVPTQVDATKKDEPSHLVKTQVDNDNHEATALPKRNLLQRRPNDADSNVPFTEFVEDQAEESEDEYAGLGGASEDEDGNEELEPEIKNMIDDETKLKKEEIASMAQYARDQEIDRDSKLVEQLMKDVTTGGLRKRRRNNVGLLDDSEDDDDEHSEIRREKLKELRRRKLMEHENLEILGGEKRKAFLATVEDNLLNTTDNLKWLDNNDEDSGIGSSELGEERPGSDPAEIDADEDAIREEDELLEKASRNYVDRSELSKTISKTSLNGKDDIVLPATLKAMMQKSKRNKVDQGVDDISSSNSKTSTLVSSTQRTSGRKFKGLMQVSNSNNKQKSQTFGTQATSTSSAIPNKPNLLASLNNFTDFD
ncbi:mediator-replication checkpoint 1 [Schizosaccharomyces cryophilus OY26]|uniref:Mediator-replication checkpoint 1 n=1 Tax=Schizosaccharomyces cryophilus (strain OY26 / ATCC MYA-4695 / CBS 11777 / NBRC 106824 / NRRL Y48691) TaxID=653667 RepID=S9XC69_SCHCR|nr:mediator-replication checkpoint 1 [Schizosaccharomyces cryophilus OY26]EPY51401.1 mediator-replication checkpoint 1 [Schizosaccharomyces cryophilus OY26]